MLAWGMQVKLWDVSNDQPSLLATEQMQVGAVFTAGFCPEAAWLFAAGGAKGTVAVWDISLDAAVQKKFGRQLAAARTATIPT